MIRDRKKAFFPKKTIMLWDYIISKKTGDDSGLFTYNIFIEITCCLSVSYQSSQASLQLKLAHIIPDH
jgi:hypothetical protein